MGVVLRLGCGASHSRPDMKRQTAAYVSRLYHTALGRSGARRILNRWSFGPSAPRPDMRVTISPKQINNRYFRAAKGNQPIGHWQTGQVLGGDWDLATREFRSSTKYQSCHKHFIDGVAWDQTKAMPYGLKKLAEQGKYDSCRTPDELVARYARLDNLWDMTCAAGALPSQLSETAPLRDCILVHITRDGELLFGNYGFHRLSIAKLAKIPKITVVVGVIHPSALKTENYHRLYAAAQ